MRLHVIAEGQTEEAFVRELLAKDMNSPLVAKGVFPDARCVLTSRKNNKKHTGGFQDYAKPRNDILDWMREDQSPDCFFTTMFDLYALPNDFPGYSESKKINNIYQKVEFLETALKEDIGKDVDARRFIPYIQIHEFEALIFADAAKLKEEYFDRDKAIDNLVAQTRNLLPEEIDDGSETAPSKRILNVIPEYDKVSSGVKITAQITLPVLRQKCRHFDEWIEKLCNLKTK